MHHDTTHPTKIIAPAPSITVHDHTAVYHHTDHAHYTSGPPHYYAVTNIHPRFRQGARRVDYSSVIGFYDSAV